FAGRFLFGEHLLGANQLPLNAESRTRREEQAAVFLDPLLGFLNDDLVVLALLAVQTDELEMPYTILQVFEQPVRLVAAMLEQLVVHAQGFGDIVLLFETLALPHPRIEAGDHLPVAGVDLLETVGGLSEQLS